MSRRTLLLEVDSTVLVDVVDPVLSYKAYREGTHYEASPVPDGARRLGVRDPGGRPRDLSAQRIATGIARRAGLADPLLGSIPVRREWGLDETALSSWSPERARIPTWHRMAASDED